MVNATHCPIVPCKGPVCPTAEKLSKHLGKPEYESPGVLRLLNLRDLDQRQVLHDNQEDDARLCIPT